MTDEQTKTALPPPDDKSSWKRLLVLLEAPRPEDQDKGRIWVTRVLGSVSRGEFVEYAFSAYVARRLSWQHYFRILLEHRLVPPITGNAADQDADIQQDHAGGAGHSD